MHHDLSLLIAIGFYIAAALLLYRSISRQTTSLRTASIACSFAGVVFHLVAQMQHWHLATAPDVSLLNLLSLCALVIVMMLCSSVFSKNSLYDASLVALPLTALVLVLEWAIPARPLLLTNTSVGTTVQVSLFNSMLMVFL